MAPPMPPPLPVMIATLFLMSAIGFNPVRQRRLKFEKLDRPDKSRQIAPARQHELFVSNKASMLQTFCLPCAHLMRGEVWKKFLSKWIEAASWSWPVTWPTSSASPERKKRLRNIWEVNSRDSGCKSSIKKSKREVPTSSARS